MKNEEITKEKMDYSSILIILPINIVFIGLTFFIIFYLHINETVPSYFLPFLQMVTIIVMIIFDYITITELYGKNYRKKIN